MKWPDWARQLVTLHEPRTLGEQLRLLLRNCTSPTIPGILLATTVGWTLHTPDNRDLMAVWWAAVVLWRLIATWSVMRMSARPDTFVNVRRSVWLSAGINAIDMVLWGSLAWIAVSDASFGGSVLVIAVLAGVAGNTMATLAPVLPVFLMAIAVELTMVVSKTWSMDDPAFHALGVAAVLYVATLIGHARNGHDAALSAIRLRFDNERLIAQLYEESENARRAQAEAERANQDKSRFLAAASHDLRQPIHAQGLFLEVLADPRLDSATHARVLSSAKAAWQASSDMLNTLLDFSRIEAGVLKPQISTFQLQPLLHRIESEVAPQADAKQLVYRTRDTALAVRSDPALVELILRNIVTNAVRYTERGGVLVGARRRGETVMLQVWDTGVGIPLVQRDEIFREFHQLGNPERDRRKGLGLGLAIAKGLATELRHELGVQSVLGRGSCFTLMLPLSRSPVIDTEFPRTPVPLMPLHLRVLVIDDDELVLDAMRSLFQRWGCECMTAESPDQALGMTWNQPPQLIVSDYRLRDQLTGASAIGKLRDHWGLQIPAILLTGDTARERLWEALGSGIPLLHKPVSPQQLHQQISKMLDA